MQDQGYTYLRTFRYERKFLVETLMPFQVCFLTQYISGVDNFYERNRIQDSAQRIMMIKNCIR